MNNNGTISFRREANIPATSGFSQNLKILSVDDDAVFQKSTSFALTNTQILGHKIELIQAYSFQEAYDILSQDTEIAIALIDVVMETEDAGIRLVKAVRESFGNNDIRLILVTGQPGSAPVHSVMQVLDINDYWTKSDLTKERLQTILTSNTRSFGQIKEIARSNEILELVGASSRRLYASVDLPTLADKILDEIREIFKTDIDSLIYAATEIPVHNQIAPHSIIGAKGKFLPFLNKSLSEIKESKIQFRLKKCLANHKSYNEPNFLCIYLPMTLAGTVYICYAQTHRQLSETETKLLQVFSMNICGCLSNVSLISELDRLAYQDEMLNLPNKNTLLRNINHIVNSKQKDNYLLLVIDIDNFSSINTVMGVNQGDALLRIIAHRLTNSVDKQVLVAHIKDDIFALFGPTELIQIDKIKKLFKRLNHFEDLANTINFSSVAYPLSLADKSAQGILTYTGIALKAAKLKGINQHVQYEPQSDSETTRRFTLLRALQKTIEVNDISVAFQPQINIVSRQVEGVEALARWKLADGTTISPVEFIPLAEATGLITQLGQQIMDKACEAAQKLAQKGYPQIKVGINISFIQFERQNIVKNLAACIDKYQIKPTQIEIEVTESVAMQNFSSVIKHLTAIRDLGVRIAIDDFGTGFSSLSHLSQIPAERLKIDKSFIDNLANNSREALVVKTIIELGRRFNMNTIAEGVETQQQLEMLKQMNCDEVQGYFFAKPMDFLNLCDWLKTHQPINLH